MIQPVYISDIFEDITARTASMLVSKNPDVTLLDRIKANEKAVHEDNSDSLIQTINYQGCHKRELIETLLQMDKTEESRDLKYPLVFLVRDFEVNRGQAIGLFGEGSFNIIIAHHTNKNYKITERTEKVFKPVLYPIYVAFMEQIAKHPMIYDASDPMIKHTLIERSYWGRQAVGGTDLTKLNDCVDALELKGLQLKINFKNC